MQECELQLLAAWIIGYNQEHIKEFDYFIYYSDLFEAIRKLKDINPLTVSKASGMKTSDVLKITNHYMPSLYDGCYKQMKTEKIKSMLSELVKTKDNITQEQFEAITKEIDMLQSVKIKLPTDLCETYKNELERRKTVEPLKYGLPTLDYLTGGLRNQELTVISARPGVGKTVLALQIAFNLALKKNKILFFSLEMSGFQLMERLACRETQIEHEKLKNPKIMNEKDNEQLETFFKTYKTVMKKYLNVIEGVRDLSAIKRHIDHYNPSVIIIDQLTQLNENKRFASKREQFSYMTNTLKAMTTDLDIPIILLAQINRDAQDREPTLADLKESGSIEEDADNVLMLHETSEPINGFVPVMLIIKKQRNGQKDIRIDCLRHSGKFIFKECTK